VANENASVKARIERIQRLCKDRSGSQEYFEAASLAQSVLYDTVGGNHPLMAELESALRTSNWSRAVAASKVLLALYDESALTSPRLAIAHEIEGSLLDIAQAQAQAAESTKEDSQKQIHLSIAAFLVGASLEDALRRLCDASRLSYDVQRASISKLQSALFQPSKQIEVITASENKHITAWGDTRNKADHGRFADITLTEVVAMILGVRTLIDKYFP
jgi:hypothetical protein